MPIIKEPTSETYNATLFLQNDQYSYFQSITGIEPLVHPVTNMATSATRNLTAHPSLNIVIQPVDKFRYRYKSEKGSHGGIAGISKLKAKKTHPMVKLENYYTHQNVVIKVRLYTAEDNPQPHVLDLVGKNCKDGVCQVKLSKDFTAQFPSMAILNKKKDEICDVLRQRRMSELESSGIDDDDEDFESGVQIKAKNINLNSARLCFEAFDANSNVSLCDKVFSSIIYNQKSILAGDLRIVRLSSATGNCCGGQEMLLFCDKIKKDDIKVRFYEKDEKDEIVWIEFATFNPSVDVHHQVGIAFLTPRYRENVERDVYIDLFQPSDEKHGEGRKFTYIPDDTDMSRFSKKRKRLNPSTSYSESSSSFQDTFTSEDSSSYVNNANDPNLNDTVIYADDNADSGHEFFSDLSIEGNFSTIEDFVKFLNDSMEGDIIVPVAQPQSFQKEGTQLLQSDGIDGRNIEVNNTTGESKVAKSSTILTSKIKEHRKLENGTKTILETRTRSTKLHDLPSVISRQDENGNTLLHRAVIERSDDVCLIAKILAIISENTVNKKNERGQTALELAVIMNNWLVLNQLLLHNGNPNITNKEGNNCLHLASKHKAVECMMLLLSPETSQKHKLNIDVFNFNGLTPLHLSVMHNNQQCLKLLLEADADVNIAEAKCGRTALHLAVELGPSLIPTLLSRTDIDSYAEDFRGFTPLHIACQLKEDEYEEVFSEIENDKLSLVSYLTRLSEDFGKLNLEEDGSERINGKTGVEDALPSVVEKKLCSFLDGNSQWRALGAIIGLDDFKLEGISFFSKNSSPTKVILEKIKMLYTCINRQLLVELLTQARLFEAVKLLY